MYTIEQLRDIIKAELNKQEYVEEPYSLFEPIKYIMEDGGKLPADFDMLQKSGNYLIHVDGEKAFCLNEREIYLKDSIINHLGIKREELPGHFVNSNYNIFNYE